MQPKHCTAPCSVALQRYQDVINVSLPLRFETFTMYQRIQQCHAVQRNSDVSEKHTVSSSEPKGNTRKKPVSDCLPSRIVSPYGYQNFVPCWFIWRHLQPESWIFCKPRGVTLQETVDLRIQHETHRRGYAYVRLLFSLPILH